jgi:hypothetical protein
MATDIPDPQMLAYYKAQFPGQLAMGMGNAPAGTNSGAGAANGLTKLMMALMQARAMQQYNKKYPQQPATPAIPNTPTPTQDQTSSAPGGMPGGMVGVPDQ